MLNKIIPGTIEAEPGTMAGEIKEIFAGLVPEDQLPQLEQLLKRVGYSVAKGWLDNIINSIDNNNYLQIKDGEIIGSEPEGGGGAPDDAEYLVGSSNGDLTAERVVTSTATVTWDLATPSQAKANVPDASTTAKGVVELSTSAETTAGLAVQASDSRLSDSRTPTTHGSSHVSTGSDPIPMATTTVRGTVELATSGENAANVVVQGNDSRLSDSRTPTTHGSSHVSTGSDPIPMATTTVRGTVELATSGENAANVVVQGNDSRLSNARTPTAHASTHLSGGSDPIAAATTSARGTVELATDGQTASGVVVQGNDGRVRGAGQSIHSVRGASLRGLTNTRIFRWTNPDIVFPAPDITYTDSSNLGGYWTIANAGVYSVSVSIRVGATATVAIKVAASLSNTFNQDSIEVTGRALANELVTMSWTGLVLAGQVIWIAQTSSTANPDNINPNYNRCTVARVR